MHFRSRRGHSDSMVLSGPHRSLIVASVEAIAVLTLLLHPLARRYMALTPCLLLPAPMSQARPARPKWPRVPIGCLTEAGRGLRQPEADSNAEESLSKCQLAEG